MATVTYSAMARADMVELWVWIASKSGEEVADTITDRIERRIAMLGDNPLMGPARSDIAEGARHLTCERWLALYRIKPDGFRLCVSWMGYRTCCMCLWERPGCEGVFSAVVTRSYSAFSHKTRPDETSVAGHKAPKSNDKTDALIGRMPC